MHKKNQKILKFRKIRKCMKKKSFWEKSFHPFKRHVQQNWRDENMPILTDRLFSKGIYSIYNFYSF